jgi:hypothetical protein
MLFVVFSNKNKNEVFILMLASPIIIWTRLSWIFFYVPFLGLLTLSFIYRDLQNKTRSQLLDVKNILLFPISLTLCLLIVLDNTYFGIKPLHMLHSFKLSEMKLNYFEYLGWFPRWKNAALVIVDHFSSSGVFLFELIMMYICAESIKLFSKEKSHLWCMRISLVFVSLAMFIFTPLNDGTHYGSTEPLGSLGVFRLHLIIFSFLAYLPTFYFQIKDAVIIKSISAKIPSLKSPYFIIAVLIFWTQLSKMDFEAATIANNNHITEIAKACDAGEIRGVYIAGAVYTHGKYLQNETQKPYLNSSILAGNLGCLSVGEERYSLKNSANEERLVYQRKANDIYEALVAGKNPSYLTEQVKELRAKKIAVMNYTGDIFWK